MTIPYFSRPARLFMHCCCKERLDLITEKALNKTKVGKLIVSISAKQKGYNSFEARAGNRHY